MSKQVIVIGAGFAGLSAAAVLAKAGYSVKVLEKNELPGGRARQWKSEGYTFDMGPSWYWMPDVFEEYFGLFDKKPQDFYDLVRLDPAYRVYFGPGDCIEVPASREALENLFEELEPGSVPGLRKFLNQAAYKYQVGMKDYVFRPSLSLSEFFDLRLIRESMRIQLFNSMSKHVRKYFTAPKLIKLLEFPVLFLGATPQNTPAMYSMMNHADLVLGTWYPMGGMYEIVKAMVAVAEDQGVEFVYNTAVEHIDVKEGHAHTLHTQNGDFTADIVVANSDYQHTDQQLLDPKYSNYSQAYWESRTMSPSSLCFYLGLNRKISGLKHHLLFFDEDFDLHAKEIYEDPKWPSKPLFYVSSTSQTDPSVAPEGHDNLFVLIPLAPGLQDDEAMREKYYDLVMTRFEKLLGQPIRDAVTVKRSYAMKDFEQDYHSYKGNAYGLANTLKQTAYFKPSLKSKKVNNLYYAGQLTVPGPGVPPSLISGQVVANQIIKQFAD